MIRGYYNTFLFLLMSLNLYSQTLTNKGAYITAQSGAFIRVNGSVQNDNAGIVTINGNGTSSSAELYVSQDVINNATINADGYIRLLGNWIDNNTYTSTLGTVFMEGANQLLSGTSPTTFFNLTLDGSGVKTQTINKYVNGVLDLKSLELNNSTFGMFVQNPSTNAILRSPALPESVQGFVSSANGGFLSRATNSTGTYLFPVGSVSNLSTNVATAPTTDDRYRPVEIVPNSATASSYTVRMANLDASTTTENSLVGYNRLSKEIVMCTTNPLFFHQINRSSGTASADINVYYIPSNDGAWQGLARWNLPSVDNTWRIISGSSTATSTAPFSVATKTLWNNFTANPYILYNGLSITANCGGPVCANVSSPAHIINSTVIPPGTYTYAWTSTPTGFTSSSANASVSPTPSVTTTYTVTVTNTTDNCEATNNCTLTVNQNPSLIFLSPP
jgi:hypothetical protein